MLTTLAAASLPIILIVRAKNEFILNVNGVLAQQKNLDDFDITALLEIYRCGVAEWYSPESFTIRSIGSDTLSKVGADYGITRFHQEPIDNYLIQHIHSHIT